MVLELSSITGTDDWWAIRLANKLGEGFPRLGRLRKYATGEALLPENEWDAATRENYRRFLQRSRLHVTETLRDARTDRQGVVGFRTAADGDDDGDLVAWKQWQRSRMELQERDFFNWIADYGRAHIITSMADDGPGFTVENEWTTITEPYATRPWLTQAGIKVGHNPVDMIDTLILFRPGYYRIAIRRTEITTIPQDGSPWSTDSDWTWIGPPIVTKTQDALVQTASLSSDGFGMWEKHIDTLDRINEITLNGLTLIVMQSFRQRAIDGDLPDVYPEDHPHAGEKVDYDDLFKSGPAALWLLPKDAKMWESNPVDVTPIYGARKDELKTLCSLTRTPQDIFESDTANQSAAGSENSKEPLIFAVKAMNKRAGVTIAHAQSIAFQLAGDTGRADMGSLEVIFQKENPATMAEKAEAAAKYVKGNASQEFIDEEVFEMTPSRRARAKQERTAEAFDRALIAAQALPQVAAAQRQGVTGGD